jgi:hypothetical protein
MNPFERRPLSAGEAQIQFLDGDFRVLKPGAYVRCAVTGAQIPLEELRYWDVDRQEAYVSPQAKLDRLGVGVKLAEDPNFPEG